MWCGVVYRRTWGEARPRGVRSTGCRRGQALKGPLEMGRRESTAVGGLRIAAVVVGQFWGANGSVLGDPTGVRISVRNHAGMALRWMRRGVGAVAAQ